MIKLMGKMETSFYHDEPAKGVADLKKRKMNMTLDLDSDSNVKKQKLNHLLASPDLNMLRLSSPDLERLIIQQNGMITTTPTPTQIVFPKYVTEEQEAYARGFIDALAELHDKKEVGPGGVPIQVSGGAQNLVLPTTVVSQSQSPPPTSVATSSAAPTSFSGVLPTSSAVPVPVMSHNQGVAVSSNGSTYTQLTNVQPRIKSENVRTDSPPVNQRLATLKEEPQTVPSIGSPPISPINMDEQEDIKLERKRERNRVAARKCRTRKLERISRLEERVSELKGQNNELVSTAAGLREQVCKLKQEIMHHVNSGCQVMLSQNLM